MSEASRQRWLFLHNRLEELLAKHGPPPEVEVPDWLDHHPSDQPSWGPLGSLVEQLLGPEEHARLLEIDAEARGSPLSPPAPEKTSSEPSAPKRVLRLAEALQTLDAFGETPLFACGVCDEESAKASVRLGLWHCTACGVWGEAPRTQHGERPPGTPLNRP